MVAITPNTPTRIAEELQCYGGNTFINFFRNEGVLYKETLCDVCDHLKVNYNEKSEISLIEENMLVKLLKDSLEQMSKKDLEELCHELGMTNIDKMISENKQLLIASVLTLFKAGGSHSYPLVIAVANAMVKKTLGHGLTAVAGKVALKKISGILAGPIGWGHYRCVSEHQSCRAGLQGNRAGMLCGCRLTPKTGTRSKTESGTRKIRASKAISKTESRTRSK